MKRVSRRITSSQIILAGFLGVILAGTLLLLLPISRTGGERCSFVDALFTATSATCVTGLVVGDTATTWSLFGQAVILLMIQLGGMGIVTMTITVAVFSGRKIGVVQRNTLRESLSVPEIGGVVRLTKFILSTALTVELLGAALLAGPFIRDFGVGRGIWYAVFHSVSAFCNAGFDLMGVNAPYSSLTAYGDHALVNITIILLILIGGLGFLTWSDVRMHGLRVRRYRMQSKVILTATAILLILPTCYFFFFEFQNEAPSQRFLHALFQAVTPRTAGFSTANLTEMSEAGVLVMILLMLIGGAPGSTAGGMKLTTLAVIVVAAWAVFRHRKETAVFGRRVANMVIRQAATVLVLYMSLFLLGGIVISRIEGFPLLTCLFETASAIATVGLTLGITPGLCVASKIILMVLMYVGRVGGLTLIFAAFPDDKNDYIKLPQENITVG